MAMKHITGIMILALLVFSACTQSQVPPDSGWPSGGSDFETSETFTPEVDIETQTFSSETELASFIAENQGGTAYGGGFGLDVARTMEMVQSVSDSVPMTGGSAKNDYSGTNVQVEGVDEADILKTDGDYIYTVTGDTLFIIKAYPGEDAEVVETIKFDSNPQGLFLDGDRLAVFGNFYDLDYFERIDFVPRQGMTYFDIYDVSNPSDPEKLESFKFEGRYFQARMTGDWVYFVTLSEPEVRPMPMPIIVRGDVLENVAVNDIARYNIPYDNPQFATINAINLETENIESKTVIVEGGQNMYMNHEHIFIASTRRVNEWEIQQEVTMDLLEPRLTSADKDLIEKIKDVDNLVLSPSEKKNKIYQIYNRYVQYMDRDEREEFTDEVESRVKEEIQKYDTMEWTVIHKISVDEGDIDIERSGNVPGTIHNQFAMDEYDGVLRVATTINPWWNRRWFEPAVDVIQEKTDVEITRNSDPTNNVYTLDRNMELMDELEGLAPGERIFSTRFVGDRLYMVTFRQVDPFFVIDLSDPNDIEELGELKIPGFSRYLHPYDEDHIIGIGRDASDTGRTRGIKISLFDVSDVNNPEEVAQWVAKDRYSQTSAEWEHKAFLFDREKNLLVLPAYSYDYEEGSSYNGALVFDIDTEDIELRGLIDHSQGSSKRYYGQMVERSLYIEDLLYTKSPNLLRINELDDLGKVKNIDLESSESPYPVY